MKYFLPVVILFAIACNTSKNVQLTEKTETEIVEKTVTKIEEMAEEIKPVEMEKELVVPPKDNEELKKIYAEDQGDRKVANVDWSVVGPRDEARQKRVDEMIDSNLVITGNDYHHAAMIFQHGGDTIASAKAVSLMGKAIEIDTTINKWLLAAAIDRDLMRRDEPQIYGTQFRKPEKDAPWELYEIDATKVTDEERMEYGVPPIAKQKERVKLMNKKKANELFEKGMTVDEFIVFCKKEDLKESEYDLSEMGLNSLGYQYMGIDNDEDALKIFILNTELYPDAYNTHDSLGECYLKMGKKVEGITAYKKSLELNPENDNATNVLKEIEAE